MSRLADLALTRTRRVLLAAAVFFLAAAAIGLPLAGKLSAQSSDFQDPNAPNQQVSRVIQRATGQSDTLGVVALVRAGDVRRDHRARREVAHVAALLRAQPGFQRVVDYLVEPSPLLVSHGGRETAVFAAFATQDDAKAAVNRVRPQLRGQDVEFGGRDIAFTSISSRISTDLERAELLAFPILLLLSFWVFRGLVAALLPPLVGGLAIVITFFFLRLIDQATSLSIFALNLVTGMGLGLAIDYSLFVLARYREELAGGKSVREALTRTLATAGRTVLYSALTVAGALASLLLFPLRFLYSMGYGGMIVALVAGAVSLIVLPAVLVVLGPRIDALAPARLQRTRARAAQASASGGWYRLSHGVMRRPGLVAVLTAAVLLALASPALRMTLAPADERSLPPGAEAARVSDALAHNFPADPSQQITVVATAPPSGGAEIAGLVARASSLPGAGPIEPAQYIGGGTWQFALLPRGDAISPANQRLVRELRALPFPTLVGGATAMFIDQKHAIASHLPATLAVLAVITFAVLFLMTGSLVLPLVALTMNLLTVAVGAGLLVVVFQDGHLSSLLDFRTAGGLEESNLVLLFTIAFALSTDYGVFLFARIRELHLGGLAARDAIAHGLERTGRLVTAAALLFCVAIGAFTTSGIVFIKELGLGTAFAVAVDATIVRALLVPALMGVLGERAWWAPKLLRRLHARAGLSESLPNIQGASA